MLSILDTVNQLKHKQSGGPIHKVKYNWNQWGKQVQSFEKIILNPLTEFSSVQFSCSAMSDSL